MSDSCRLTYNYILFFLTVCLLVESIRCVPAEGKENKYLPLYKKAEKFNFEEIVQSHRLFKNYVNCFIDKGPCTESGKNGKVLLRDLMDTLCKDVCSDKLVRNFQIALKAFRDRHPAEWEIYLKKADPKGTKRERLFKFMEGKD